MRAAPWLALLAALLLLPALAGGEPATSRASYIAGTHTLVGSINNLPALGTLPVSTATAVCQQDVRLPVVNVRLSTPSVGGACAIPLPGPVVTIVVADAVLPPAEFEVQPVNATGGACGGNVAANSGDTLAFAPRCVGLNVWPNVRATYGTITLTAAG